jgi:adenylate cyclase
MHSPDLSTDRLREQLEKILSSPGFARNERLSNFLRFIVERDLEGKGAELKESLVGVEVFERTPGYDPKQDSIVRTEAAKLRARLATYYGREGAADPIVIDLPKGGYVPVFRRAETPRSKSPKRLVASTAALASIALILAMAGWWWVRQKNAPIRIAVLPLQNVSQDKANEYYADGLTSEIISNLSAIEGLTVRSQTSSFAFKGKPRNVREVGEQLSADYIVEGSVLRSGQHLRVNVQLVRARDDFPLWSDKFDRELSSAFAIQDEIALGVVNSLRVALGRGRRRYETSAEAYELYLRARALPVQRGLYGYDEAIAPLQQAIAKDPKFAPAYAGLAAAYAARSGQYRLDISEEVRKLRAMAEEAIRLDPLLAEAHDALGMVHARDGRWTESEKSFRRAIELDPSRSDSYMNFTLYFLWPLGRTAEGLAQLRKAEEMDPLSPHVHFKLGWMLISLGRYRDAEAYCHKLPGDYTGRTKCVGRALVGQGRTDEAIRLFARSEDRSDRSELGYAYARVGRRADAEKLALDLAPRPIQQAAIFAGLGDKDRALDALARVLAVGPVRFGLLLTTPELAMLRDDPRLKALRKNVGLPE